MIPDTVLRRYTRRAVFVARLLRWVPFVELVGLNGSLASNMAHQGSDIDLYIVTTPNRLYTVRALTILTVLLTGLRRHGKSIAGRICLNRFATRAGLTITPRDSYHARVFSPLVPLFFRRGIYARYRAANEWMAGQYWPVIPLPSWRRYIGIVKSSPPLLVRLLELMGRGRVGDAVEARLSVWQRERILRHQETYHPDSRVFIRAQELCLHLTKQ